MRLLSHLFFLAWEGLMFGISYKWPTLPGLWPDFLFWGGIIGLLLWLALTIFGWVRNKKLVLAPTSKKQNSYNVNLHNQLRNIRTGGEKILDELKRDLGFILREGGKVSEAALEWIQNTHDFLERELPEAAPQFAPVLEARVEKVVDFESYIERLDDIVGWYGRRSHLGEDISDPHTLKYVRKNWKPSAKCLRRLRELRPAKSSVEITRHDKPSFVLARTLSEAFEKSGWESVAFHKEEWGESPVWKEGIEVQGTSDKLVRGVIAALEGSGLPRLTANVWKPSLSPDDEGYLEEIGFLRFRVGIEE